jgi:hypothetical protein
MSDASIGELAFASESFRVGGILSKSLKLFLGNIPKYFMFGAVAALPQLISAIYFVELTRMLVSLSRGTVFAVEIGFVLFWVALFSVCETALIYGAFQDIRGRPFEIGASLGRAGSRIIPAIGAAICAVALVMMGSALLAVPGIICLTMFFVVIPVSVVESLGPLRSLGRSRELTKGHRWRILAIYLVPAAVISIVNFVVLRFGIRLAGIAGYATGTFLITAIGSTYQAIVNIVTYHGLRSVKEGLDIEHLAAVFD